MSTNEKAAGRFRTESCFERKSEGFKMRPIPIPRTRAPHLTAGSGEHVGWACVMAGTAADSRGRGSCSGGVHLRQVAAPVAQYPLLAPDGRERLQQAALPGRGAQGAAGHAALRLHALTGQGQ